MSKESNRRYWQRKRERKLKKRLELQKLGLWTPVEPSVKQPGTQRQRRYARRLLKCEQVSENEWRVWGGENEHVVKREDSRIVCDCYCSAVENKPCTHIIKLHFEYGIPVG
jgi:hypothetical protein